MELAHLSRILDARHRQVISSPSPCAEEAFALEKASWAIKCILHPTRSMPPREYLKVLHCDDQNYDTLSMQPEKVQYILTTGVKILVTRDEIITFK